MKNISLYYLLLRLSKAIKVSNHLDLVLIKEALINYYNAFTQEKTPVAEDAKGSIVKYLLNRCVSDKSNALMKAILVHTICGASTDTIKELIAYLILTADASVSALEEADYLRKSNQLVHKRSAFFYSGVIVSDIAKVRYRVQGESRGKDSARVVHLCCDCNDSSENLALQLLNSSL